jgi:hypothetical protein
MGLNDLGFSPPPYNADDACYLVFDFETGGLDPKTCSPTQLAMAVCTRDFTHIDHYQHHIFPTIPVDPYAASLNGYNEEKWASVAIPLPQAEDVFFRWMKQFFKNPAYPPIGICHNFPTQKEMPFDFLFLQAYLPSCFNLLARERIDSCVVFKDWRDRTKTPGSAASEKTGPRWKLGAYDKMDRKKGLLKGHVDCTVTGLALVAGLPTKNLHDAFWDVDTVVKGLQYLKAHDEGEAQ